MSVRINQRWPEELKTAVDTEAERFSLTATQFTITAVRAYLAQSSGTLSEGSSEPTGFDGADRKPPMPTEPLAERSKRQEPVHFTPTIPSDGSPEAGGPTHHCPVHGCTYFAYSPAAVCSKHGRTVKPV